MLRREDGYRRLLEPDLYIARRNRLSLPHRAQDRARGRDDDACGTGLEVGNRLAINRARDAHLVDGFLFHLGGPGRSQREERRLPAVLLERDRDRVHLRAWRGDLDLNGSGLADVLGGPLNPPSSDTLTLNSGDIIALGTGTLDPDGTGSLPSQHAVRIDGEGRYLHREIHQAVQKHSRNS